jgi:hypothetical protein
MGLGIFQFYFQLGNSLTNCYFRQACHFDAFLFFCVQGLACVFVYMYTMGSKTLGMAFEIFPFTIKIENGFVFFDIKGENQFMFTA